MKWKGQTGKPEEYGKLHNRGCVINFLIVRIIRTISNLRAQLNKNSLPTIRTI